MKPDQSDKGVLELAAVIEILLRPEYTAANVGIKTMVQEYWPAFPDVDSWDVLVDISIEMDDHRPEFATANEYAAANKEIKKMLWERFGIKWDKREQKRKGGTNDE